MYARDSQSLDASNDGVEGSLNISGGAGGHNGLGLFMEQLGHILHRNRRERDTMGPWTHNRQGRDGATRGQRADSQQVELPS